MSDEMLSGSAVVAPEAKQKSFVYHAKLIGLLTLGSRVLGLVREMYVARYFGAGLVSAAFTVAFTIPNLFRRLFGEGALSAAFIPLYAQALKQQHTQEANRFAAASVNLLVAILVGITVAGELLLAAIAWLHPMAPDRLLALKLTAIMLPYVLLVCGAAFLGAILQVHRRFGLVAALPILLNVALIASTVAGAWYWDMGTLLGQTRAMYFVSVAVLAAGVLQVAVLVRPLRAIGFRFELTSFWTPAVRRMLKLSIPVAVGAGVLQLSVLIDRGLSFFLAQSIDAHGAKITTFTLFGEVIRYPLEYGAAARLAWAQYLYQFPLGIFATALATAIFPALSADALDADRQKFRGALLKGMKVALWEGLPASVGLILVAEPAVQLLFERGRFTPHDTQLVAGSLRLFAVAIWAFSLQQIISRAYYALHDTMTPLIASVVTLVVDLSVKMTLIWSMGEAGMAAGTAASFTVQALVMLLMLQRRIGGLALGELGRYVIKLLVATALMAGACLLVQRTSLYPMGPGKLLASARLSILIGTGGAVYVAACFAMGVSGLEHLRPRKSR